MKKKITMFTIVLRIAGAVAILSLASVGALSQDAAPATPDGTQARSVLKPQIHHVTISVADIHAETNWYIEKLGFTLPEPLQKIGPKMQGCRLKMPGFQLDLIQYEGSQRAKTQSPVFLAQGFIHIVFSVADLDKALSFLQAAGTDVTANRNREGKLGGLLLHDPEGNEIEITLR